jgi:LytS/YehU family sensor histidine kinase
LLIRQGNLSTGKFGDFFLFAIHASAVLFVCWLINGYFLIHKLSSLTNQGRHLLGNVFATMAAFTLNYLIYVLSPRIILIDNGFPFDTLPHIITHLAGAFFISIISYVVFYSIHTNSALQNSKLENEILEQAHLRAQLLSLQQQISPHFLFNSLSTLKTIAQDQPTKNYIIQLAAVYRYVLNFNESYLSPLKDELAFIKSYLYIMNERFEDALVVGIQVSDDHLKFQIPSLSLQLLIENAIKHNMISPDHILNITIFTDDSPALIVTNNYQPKKVPEEGTGTGLKNITERYRLLMDRPVQIINDGKCFTVTLPLLRK